MSDTLVTEDPPEPDRGTPPDADLEARAAEVGENELAHLEALPWWRRPRRMRRQLSITLALVSLVSVILIGSLNFIAADDLLQEGTRSQLAEVAESRARSIEEGADRLLAGVSTIAADLAVSAAVTEFTTAAEELTEESLDEAQVTEVESFYETRVIEPLATIDVERTLDDLLPRTDAGQYLQYHYTVAPGDERAEVVDAGDGSTYSEVHAAFHPFFRELAATYGYGDIKLTDVRGNVIYSSEKQLDLGTSLVTGPHMDTNMASTFVDVLPRARTGDAVMSDFELYLPNRAEPTAFAMAAVRSETELIGAVIVEVPVEALNRVTTADGQWEAVGLGDGESYLVGADEILRSESRLWIEDPEKYLDEVGDERLAEVIRFLDSPVGLQPADTEPVRAALDGEVFEGRAANYLGKDSYSYARLIDISGVNWVVVADVPHSSAQSPLYSYLWRIAITLIILLPVAAVLGAFIAGRVTRPIPRILRAAQDVVDGDRDPQLPDFGRNEFGDLARRLHRTAGRLGTQEAELEAQYDETRAVLLAALPPRVVSQDTRSAVQHDLTDVGTAVAVAIDFEGDELHVDDSMADLFAAASQAAEHLAAARGIERVRAAADRYLFVSGLGETHDGVDPSLDFAVHVVEAILDLAHGEGVSPTLQVGVSTGVIETGLMTRGNVAYTAWGEPVRAAMMIGSLSKQTLVGVDETTVRAAGPDWRFRDAAAIVGLDGREHSVSELVLDDPPTR